MYVYTYVYIYVHTYMIYACMHIRLYIYILLKLWSSCLLDCLMPSVDSIIQGFSRPVMKVGRIIVPPVIQLFRSK